MQTIVKQTWTKFLELFRYKSDITRNYEVKFRVSFPTTASDYAETEQIRIVLPATSLEDAKLKLQKYGKKKVKFTVINIAEK